MSLYDMVKNSPTPEAGLSAFRVYEVRNKRFLDSVQLEITPFCNFTCPFCYARQTPEQLKEKGERLLRYEDWKKIIDQFYEMKVNSLTLSGGECTLHPDFEKIYRYAYSKNFTMGILSNGSNITDSILKTFLDCPPAITITLYGSSPEKYEKVCGNAKYFDIVMENLKKLKKNKIDFRLQTTISKDNLLDIKNIENIAKGLDVPYITSAEHINYRRCDDDIIEENACNDLEYKNQIKIHHNEKNSKYTPLPKAPIIEKGNMCGAGRSSCSINYNGNLQLCTTLDVIKFDATKEPVKDCWQKLIEYADNIPQLVDCQNCVHISQCNTCLALHYNDTKEFGVTSPRLCYKKRFPENAKQIEEFYEKNGYIDLSMYDYTK